MAQVRRLVPLLALAAVVAVSIAALAGGVGRGRNATARPAPTPTIFRQVRRAAEAGPGFLDYCPTQSGRLPAKYDITLPGAPRASGWCETDVRRGRDADSVTFRAHWQEVGINPRNGTLVLTYSVPKKAAPHATPVVQLVQQSGQVPP